MRAFHELVFDDWMVGTDITFSGWPGWLLLGSVDRLKIFIAADSVGGTTPGLNLFVAESCEGVYFNVVKIPFSNEPLSPTSVTTLTATYSPSDAASPNSHSVGFLIQLAGTSPKAHIRIWVTGRLN